MREAPLKLVTIDPKASAKAEVVNLAKTILEMAEAGELVDLSYFAATVDGSVQTGMTATEDQHRRIAACSRMMWRLQKSADTTTEGF